MPRLLLQIFLVVIGLSAVTPSLVQASEKTNPSVACVVSLRESKSAPGSVVTLEVKLTPIQGIHVNMTPPIEIRLDTNGIVGSSGSIQFPKPTNEGYFNTSRPLSLPLTLATKTPPGKHVLRGTIIYFFCSDKDGICSRFKQKFEVSLTVGR